MNKILFYHGETDSVFIRDNKTLARRFTIAGQFIEDDLYLAISICNPNDQFRKQTGRNKAKGRLLSQNFVGKRILSLYCKDYFIPTTSNQMFNQDWFVGKEVKIFLQKCYELSRMTFSEIKKEFYLNH